MNIVNGRDGKPIEIVAVEQEGCTGCLGATPNATVFCAVLPPCANTPLQISQIWVEATPENIARSVAERMSRA